MIALNLLLVFVFDFSDTKKIVPLYYIFPVLASVVIQIYPMSKSEISNGPKIILWFLKWLLGYLGYASGNCFYRVEGYDELFKAPDYDTRVNTLEWYVNMTYLIIVHQA